MDDEARQGYVKAGKIASRVRVEAIPMIKEGALLLDVAEFVESEIGRLGGRPAFPVNIAIDNVAAHYTPHSKDTQRFKVGQLVKLDLGVHVDGYIADTAVSVEVASKSWQELIGASSTALDLVIEMIRPGVLARDIGSLVERTIVSKGFVPVSNLSGHRLQKFNLHAGISIPNIGDDSMDMVKEGMALAVEPFATNGAGRVAGRKSGNIFRLVRKRSFGDKVLDSLVTAM
ncbi:MAG: type II methionyl aminopeptidase, partial [Thermoplasmata archaeon]|nr:type II methionyl aminopeptidase [Thermoplasmata archaeon]